MFVTGGRSENADRVQWRIGSSAPPSELSTSSPFLSTLIPRTLAWFSVDDDEVALLDGFSGAAYTPPTLFFGSGALPPSMMNKLKQETKICTLSLVTLHDPPQSYRMAATRRNHDNADSSSPSSSYSPTAFSFAELGLSTVRKQPNAKDPFSGSSYPVGVASSPIHMLCSLDKCVDLGNGDDLVVLTIETFHVSGSVLSQPTKLLKSGGRDIKAKIDVKLIQPVVSLGDNTFASLREIRSMPRPKQTQDGDGGGWTSNNLDMLPQESSSSSMGAGANCYESMEWSFREHGSKCPLGYNAVTALILPRIIGWISTYRSHEDKTLHLAPYSFFTDVSRRDDSPMVAFSGYRTNNGQDPKDAQKDAEESGAFGYNAVTERLAVPMNYSSAPLGRNESEFRLAQLEARTGDVLDVPLVADGSPIQYECEYFKTIPLAEFSIVIGKVRAVSVDRSILVDGKVDASRLQPITRLGYMDEYGLIGAPLSDD